MDFSSTLLSSICNPWLVVFYLIVVWSFLVLDRGGEVVRYPYKKKREKGKFLSNNVSLFFKSDFFNIEKVAYFSWKNQDLHWKKPFLIKIIDWKSCFSQVLLRKKIPQDNRN